MKVPISELVTGEPNPSEANAEVDAEVLATTVGRPVEGEPVVIDAAGRRAAAAHGIDLDAVLAAEKVRGRAGEVTRVPVASVHWLLIGVGGGEPDDLRRAGAALGRRVRGRRTLATSLVAGRERSRVRAGVTGLLLGGYAPPATGTKNRDDARPVGRITMFGTPDAAAVAAGRRDAEATVRARVLAVTPSSVKNPAWMVEQARQVAAEAGLTITVWDADRLAAEGFGGLVAVGGGSASPPAMVRLDYRPEGDARRAPVVLIGKGITFDTGGVNLKPVTGMLGMKADMAGAADVAAAVLAAAELGLPITVRGYLCLAENMPGGHAQRPNDVVIMRNGTSVEILDTDAEGRMVLGDGLCLAAEARPDVIVDIATLTGIQQIALGRIAAVMGNDDGFRADVLNAAGDAGEDAWPMPLPEQLRSKLDSQVADLAHKGDRDGGMLTAAIFLRHFVPQGVPWAHLDIAGPAFNATPGPYGEGRGATAYGVATLLRLLEVRARG